MPHRPLRVRIGEQIRRRRLDLGLSLREAAPRTGVAFATLGQIETGRLNTTVDVLEAIEHGLDFRLAELIVPVQRFDRLEVLRRFAAILPDLPDSDVEVLVEELALLERERRQDRT